MKFGWITLRNETEEHSLYAEQQLIPIKTMHQPVMYLSVYLIIVSNTHMKDDMKVFLGRENVESLYAHQLKDIQRPFKKPKTRATEWL